MAENRPVKIKSKNDAFRVRNALCIILWSLSTRDLEYLRDLRNWVWNLDFVWVVLDDIIEARKLKMEEVFDEILNEPNI